MINEFFYYNSNLKIGDETFKSLDWNHSSFKKNEIYGIGHSYCHHGEILQGEFYSDKHKLYVYGLCTLKCDIYYSKTKFFGIKNNKLNVYPQNKTKAREAVGNLLQHLNINLGGDLFIDSNIKPKVGFGSSTADVLSSILSVLNYLSIDLDERDIARLAVKSEIASDSIMFNEEVLFAQRKGLILDKYKKNIPPIHVLGFSDPYNKGYCTVKMKPIKYSSSERKKFDVLRMNLRDAIASQNAHLLGNVSTESALINQNYYEKKNIDKILGIMEDVKSVGLQISHSGNLLGLIWEYSTPFIGEKIESAKNQLRSLDIKSFWEFTK